MTEESENQQDKKVEDDWGAALAEQEEASSSIQNKVSANKQYDKAQFDQLQSDSMPSGDEVNLEVLLDVPVTLSVEIGRTRQTIRNLLQLNQGSVVELDRLAGEPMDVLVNGTLIAHGEIVVVNEKFGIRLTDVISAAERVKKLK